MPPWVQISSGAILLTALAGTAAWNFWNISPWLSAPVSALLIGGMAWGSLQAMLAWRKRGDRQFTVMHRAIADLRKLSLVDARARARLALKDPERFECRREPLGSPLPKAIPPAIQDLLSEYSLIQARAGEGRISRDSLGPAEYRKDFIRIGTDSDSVELVIRPGEESVFEIDGDDESDGEGIAAGGIPSAYHWILITEEVLYGKYGPGDPSRDS